MPSNTDHSERAWLVTGASGGIGRALCEEVIAAGERLVAAGRNIQALEDIVRGNPKAMALELDIASTESVNAGVKRALDWAGRIDVLVNNAGYGIVGALEEVDEDQIVRAFNVNVIGAYRMIRAVLPHMRERRSGHILNVSSALGLFAKPGYTWYSATKFGLEGLTEAFAQEMASFNIKVTAVEPGSFRTGFRNGNNMYISPATEAYEGVLGAFRRDLSAGDGKQPGDPVRGARAIMSVVNHPNPPLRLLMGKHTVENTLKKIEAMEKEIAAWRATSLATSFEGSE